MLSDELSGELRTKIGFYTDLVALSRDCEYDLSLEMLSDAGEAYVCQQDLRFGAQSLLSYYSTIVILTESAIGSTLNERLLKVFDEVLTQFGDHPFHHVIEGEIACIVQSELGIAGNISELFNRDSLGNPYTFDEEYSASKVPLRFMRYADFGFTPYNDPHLNYETVLDIIKTGSLDMIPPLYRGRFLKEVTAARRASSAVSV